MKIYVRMFFALLVLGLFGATAPEAQAQSTINFEAPPLGANDRAINNPYTDATTGVIFTTPAGIFGDEVVGLVKNSATSACAEPADSNQKLGTGRADGTPGGHIGLSGFEIRATFATPLAPPVSVSVEFQTGAGQPIRLRLFNAAGAEVGAASDTANPPAGTCGYPGSPRARKSITATASEQVAYAIMDMDAVTGGYVFVLDNFQFSGGTGSNFPTGPADDVTQSLGSFRILVHPAFQGLMAGYPGFDGVSRLQSPNLYDPNTVIGRSAVHTHGSAADVGGTPVGTAGTVIADSDLIAAPAGFQGPAGTREVHTEVRALNMTSWQCIGVPGVNVRAGIHAPGRPVSPGEVEALGASSDFPAESFFDVFAEIDLPAMMSFPGGTLYNPDPLVVSNASIDAFPPRVVYVHVNSSAVPVLFRDNKPGFWNAGDLFGWIVLAGHAPGFDCEHGGELTEVVQQQPEAVPAPVEVDQFLFSEALVTLQTAAGGQETVKLRGPTTVHVFIDQATGAAQDTDKNGLDEVQTRMMQLELTGNSSFGPVRVRLNDAQPSQGMIEEKVNNTPGVLDLPPFAKTGEADSFFDVFFEVEVGPPGQSRLLHTAEPVRMATTISHKPPAPGEGYRNPFTQPVDLLDENGKPTGLQLVQEIHVPNPPTEHDLMEETQAVITLIKPGGAEETIGLSGPTQVDVFFEGTKEGDARDDDGDGLEEVDTQIQKLDLVGMSSMGPVQVRLNPNIPSTGLIEEQQNNTKGTLDLPPFTPTGTANSFFDVLFEVQVGDIVLHTITPKRMRGVINHKPPALGDLYENPDTIPLYDAQGNQTEFALGPGRHVPKPPVEKDRLENTQAVFTLIKPDQSQETISLSGPTLVHVFFEGTKEGDAADDDNNGREEVRTEIKQLQLTGVSSIGPIEVRLNPNIPSVGLIEEQQNNTAGTLDLPPFTAGGAADSFFDVFFEVQVGDKIFHTTTPKHMQSVIHHKPPAPGDGYQNPQTIPLLDANGRPTGFAFGPGRHVPRPPVEIDHFESTNALITLIKPDGSEETIRLNGPTTVTVFFEGTAEGKANDDDGDGLDEVDTRIQAMKLSGLSSLGPVEVRLNPAIPSRGEIEEKANNTPGTLDLPPFTPTGAANSFFDVFFEVQVGRLVLHTRDPKHMTAMLTYKPPGIGDTYENPQILPLYTANGQKTGFSIGPARHTPHPRLEIDQFETTRALVGLRMPNGQLVNVILGGPAKVEVDLSSLADLKTVGVAGSNGLEEVDTELVQMELTGNSALGAITLRAGRAFGLPASQGQIEEKTNKKTGRLDLPGPDAPLCTPPTPADCVGTQANSFFDVFFEVEVAGVGKVHNRLPLHIAAMIDKKPPTSRYIHVISEPIELFDENERATGIFLVTAEHNTGPVEVDVFETTRALVGIKMPNGTLVNAILGGPATVEVELASLKDAKSIGAPGANGLEEVDTELIRMELTGSGMTLRAGRAFGLPASRGQIEEKANKKTGRLDLPGPDAPFCTPPTPADCVGTQANSFFDVFFEVEVANVGKLHNKDPLRIEAMIDKKPPTSRYIHVLTQPIELYDANNRATGIFLVTAEHNTGPVEVDVFETTSALVGIKLANGALVNAVLSGPATIEVELASLKDLKSIGAPGANGLEEVDTELIRMELTGAGMKLRAGRAFGLPASKGQIEEKTNKKSGRLDLPGPDAPFCTPPTPADCVGTQANSFFDVFFEVEVANVGKLHNKDPLRIEAMIDKKPPTARYIHVLTQPIELYDANNRATGIFLVTAEHNTGPVEVDVFETTSALVGIKLPNGALVNAVLSGPARIEVDLASLKDAKSTGTPGANNLEEVDTELVQMQLTGNGMTLRAGRAFGLPASRGQIEEAANKKVGRLDLPGPDAPFCTPPTPADCVGTQANSFFDIFFEIDVPNVGKLYNKNPLRIASVIDRKPPVARYNHVLTQPIELFDAQGKATGIFLVTAEHNTQPVERDIFPRTLAAITLETPLGRETVRLRGPTTVYVFIDETTGAASDSDGDGLDQVKTQMTRFDLRGYSSLGPVVVRLNEDRLSRGEMEEVANNTQGKLDIPPFTNTGAANSFFDVFFEVQVAGKVLHNAQPLRMESRITRKPPAQGNAYRNPFTQTVTLVDADGKPTNIKLVREIHVPVPHRKISSRPRFWFILVIQTAKGPVRVLLNGPALANLLTDLTGQAEDTDGDGLDQVQVDLDSLNLMGVSSLGTVKLRLSDTMSSTGEIEEKVNRTPGVLDIPPFTGQGSANSFFDIFFELEITPPTALTSATGAAPQVMILHSEGPVRVEANLTNGDPLQNTSYAASLTAPVELLDDENKPSGLSLVEGVQAGERLRVLLPVIRR